MKEKRNALPRIPDGAKIAPGKRKALPRIPDGARAAEAEKEIRTFGFKNVRNIGGILYYDGEKETAA